MWRGILLNRIREIPTATQFNSHPLSLLLFYPPAHFSALSRLITLPIRTQKCRQNVDCMSLSANGSGMRFSTVYTKNILIFYYEAKTYKIIFCNSLCSVFFSFFSTQLLSYSTLISTALCTHIYSVQFTYSALVYIWQVL